MRQVHDQYKVTQFKSHSLLGFHVFVRERCIQVLLFFRRHGLSGSLDSLGQLRAYSMSPCRILGPIVKFLLLLLGYFQIT